MCIIAYFPFPLILPTRSFRKGAANVLNESGEIKSPEATGSARFAPRISSCSRMGSMIDQIRSVENWTSSNSLSGSSIEASATASIPKIRAARVNGAHWVGMASVSLPMASATRCCERIIPCMTGLSRTFSIFSSSRSSKLWITLLVRAGPSEELSSMGQPKKWTG